MPFKDLDPNLLESIVGGQRVTPKPAQLAQPTQKPQSMFRGPGMSGLLADLAQVFSASDPKSWQHQLGGMVATKATADVFSKYTKNLEDIISGESEAKSPMEGLTSLESQRIPPEQRALSLEAIISGEKMEQGRRGLDIREEQVGALKGYYEDIGGYYDFLKTKTPEERDQYRVVETEDGMIAYNLTTNESTLIGKAPTDATKLAPGEMTKGQEANLIRGLDRDASVEAGRMLEMQGLGSVVQNPDGSVGFRFTKPGTDPKLFEDVKQRALTTNTLRQLKAGTIDEAMAGAILNAAMTPEEAREHVPGEMHMSGEYFLLGGVLQRMLPDGVNYEAVQGGK